MKIFKQSKNNSLDLINKIILRVLAIGIVSTFAFYIIGLILLFTNSKMDDLNSFTFTSVKDFYISIIQLRAKPFLFLGTLSLILTPISRVFLSIFLFRKEKERSFFLITTIVALIIVTSIIMGFVFALKLG